MWRQERIKYGSDVTWGAFDKICQLLQINPADVNGESTSHLTEDEEGKKPGYIPKHDCSEWMMSRLGSMDERLRKKGENELDVAMAHASAFPLSSSSSSSSSSLSLLSSVSSYSSRIFRIKDIASLREMDDSDNTTGFQSSISASSCSSYTAHRGKTSGHAAAMKKQQQQLSLQQEGQAGVVKVALLWKDGSQVQGVNRTFEKAFMRAEHLEQWRIEGRLLPCMLLAR